MNIKLVYNAMIAILITVLLFHVLVLTQFIDFKNVWGGRLTDKQEMYVFEGISICLNIILLFVILQKANYINQKLPKKVINVILWVFVFIFGINSIGNLFANTLLEKILGTILTIILTYLCWRIAKQK